MVRISCGISLLCSNQIYIVGMVLFLGFPARLALGGDITDAHKQILDVDTDMDTSIDGNAEEGTEVSLRNDESSVLEIDTDKDIDTETETDSASDSAQQTATEFVPVPLRETIVNNARWYVNKHGSVTGPFFIEQLRQKAASRDITRHTLLCLEGSREWVKAKKVLDFSGVPPVLWYLLQNLKTTGPFTRETIKRKIDNGVIFPNAKVNEVGTGQWVAISTVFTIPYHVRQRFMQGSKMGLQQGSPLSQSDSNYLAAKANSVVGANILTGVAMIGSAVGFGMQIAGVSSGDKNIYIGGLVIGVGFGVLRFSGVIASGVAATRYTRKTGEKSFSWGLMGAGLLTALAGAVIVTAGQESGEMTNEALYGAQVGTQFLLNIFWVAHCVRARNVTKKHRITENAPPPNDPFFTVAPFVNTASNNYGLSLVMSY